jgi:hypothetical protein
LILLPGGEVPNWFRHKRIGSSLSFQIPSLAEGQIKGLLVCAVCAPRVQTAPKSSSLSININSRPCGIPSRLTREIRKDHICLRYLPVSLIEAEIASGKEINIDCEVRGSFEVKECGTHVIVDDPNAMVSAKRGRDDNEAGPSNDWSSDENCPKRLRIDL